jgi:hypothetical protein
MERLQSSIEKCIAGVATNYAAREEKFDARWDKMFEKQEVKIGLLKTNVAAIKRKEDLALLTTDISSMCAEVKAWHKTQCNMILPRCGFLLRRPQPRRQRRTHQRHQTVQYPPLDATTIWRR